ncbi:hemerythrin domain-containing protein [Nonomuraea turkmeniaca]|uniref:Hemerythrin domain-containing protein n=1 Tax=Nonomuraea turkmeniaca TaxID=103838 RepID=A0A5S4EZZ7_9ACTN|nr:hemerythrin domain-containing protein [Nonomuraea turkmeniaca]TMR09224.1 hemerythrin domain-containing protein [Nonomuraea turkmeniaca]
MADDVITLIMADHRKVEELFARLVGGKGDQRAIVAELHALLTAHARAEEDLVYPGLDAHHGLEEHKRAEVLLDALNRAELGSAEFKNVRDLLAMAVSHHVREEESTILPLLARTVDPSGLKRLGKAFSERRQQELRALTATDGARKTRGGGSGSHDLTKAKLYEQARKADIPGRSRMSKTELEKALAKTRS